MINKQKITELKEKIRLLRGRLEEKGELNYQEIIRELDEKVEELEKELRIEGSEKNSLQRQLDSKLNELNIKTSENRSLTAQLERKVNDKEELKKQIRRLDDEIKQSRDEIDVLTDTLPDSVDACALFYKEKMMNHLRSDLNPFEKNANAIANLSLELLNNFWTRFYDLNELIKVNKKTKAGKRWQDLFDSLNNCQQILRELQESKQFTNSQTLVSSNSSGNNSSDRLSSCFDSYFSSNSSLETEISMENQSVFYNWTNIHPNFTEGLGQNWANLGFNYAQIKDWANAFGTNFNPQDHEFINWLAKVKGYSAETVLNDNRIDINILKQEFLQSQQQIQILHNPPKRGNH